MEKDEEYMRLAIEWSRRGMQKDNMGPVGAVIVRNGQILGEGHNRTRLDLDITAHGEMVAIRDGIRRTGDLEGLVGATIYTNCQPCPMCYSACKWAGIRRIVYSLSIEDTYEVGKDFGFLDVEHFADVRKEASDIPQSQLLREEALPVLQEWARLSRAAAAGQSGRD